jgi:hypothetical protein
MMRLRTSPLVIACLAVLGACNVYLIFAIVQAMTSVDRTSTDDASWTPRLARPDNAETQTRLAIPDQIILRHPVFSRSRAPFVPPPPPAPKARVVGAPVFTDPGFVLGGVMLNGEAKRAFLLRKGNQIAAWAAEGDDVEGWKLQSITAETATLQKESHVIELRLYPER